MTEVSCTKKEPHESTGVLCVAPGGRRAQPQAQLSEPRDCCRNSELALRERGARFAYAQSVLPCRVGRQSRRRWRPSTAVPPPVTTRTTRGWPFTGHMARTATRTLEISATWPRLRVRRRSPSRRDRPPAPCHPLPAECTSSPAVSSVSSTRPAMHRAHIGVSKSVSDGRGCDRMPSKSTSGMKPAIHNQQERRVEGKMSGRHGRGDGTRKQPGQSWIGGTARRACAPPGRAFADVQVIRFPYRSGRSLCRAAGTPGGAR